jgi:hypothetical protein
MIGLTLASFAKGLFNGDNKKKRQERKAEKAEAKAEAKALKEKTKDAITGGGVFGAKAGQMWTNFTGWLGKNKEIILIITGSVLVVWLLYKFVFKKGTRRRSYSRRVSRASAPRRRSTSSAKARMARVRSFRKKRR